MLTLGLAADEAEHGIGANCLWPRTIIATAAVQNLLGGDAAMAAARTPEIYADAAYEILRRDPRECTGNAFIDDEVLAEAGITDLSGLQGGRGRAGARPVRRRLGALGPVGLSGVAGRPDERVARIGLGDRRLQAAAAGDAELGQRLDDPAGEQRRADVARRPDPGPAVADTVLDRVDRCLDRHRHDGRSRGLPSASPAPCGFANASRTMSVPMIPKYAQPARAPVGVSSARRLLVSASTPAFEAA